MASVYGNHSLAIWPRPVDCAEQLRNATLQMDANITSIKRDMYSVAVPVYVAICVLVMIANATVLCAARAIKNTAKEHPTLPLTLSLAVADLWTSVVMAFSFVYNSYLFFVFGITANACVSLAFEAVRMGGLITGSLHLLALAIIHYMTIRFPTSYQNIVTSKTNWATIILIWLAPPISLFIFMSSLPGKFFRSPYIRCQGYCLRTGIWHTLEFRLVIFFAFFSPFILMSIFYLMFLILFRRQERKFCRVPNSNSSSSTAELFKQQPRRHSSIKKQKSQRQQLQKSRRTFTTTLLIWFTFMLGWMPACSLFVLTCHTCPIPFPRETVDNVRAVFIMSVISNLFILCKSLVNPIIYAIRIPEIKMALTKRYGGCFRVFSLHRGQRSTRTSSSQRCTFRRQHGDDEEMVGQGDVEPKQQEEGALLERGNEPNSIDGGHRRKLKSGGRDRKTASIRTEEQDGVEHEKHLPPQERDNLLKKSGLQGIDCEMYENRDALELECTKAPEGGSPIWFFFFCVCVDTWAKFRFC